jgi:hypothetical protein
METNFFEFSTMITPIAFPPYFIGTASTELALSKCGNQRVLASSPQCGWLFGFRSHTPRDWRDRYFQGNSGVTAPHIQSDYHRFRNQG